MATDIQNENIHEEQNNVPVIKENEISPESLLSETVEAVPEVHEEFTLKEHEEPTVEEEVGHTAEPVDANDYLKVIDYSGYEKTELNTLLEEIINKGPVHLIVGNVESIKTNFYKKHRAEFEEKRKVFIDAGGNLVDYKPAEDEREVIFKQLYKKYKDQKAAYNDKIEKEKQENLKAKFLVIEEIKELVNSKEKINKTYQDFRELQQRWRSIGPVPQAEVAALWQTYHHHVEVFYDVLKLNKESRDLDLKKNLEEKIRICERAEELLLEPTVIKAFQKLQELHFHWREIGPVPNEKQDEVWERFKQVTTIINKKHQDYFDAMKHEQDNNLEAKTMICEKAEEITEISVKTPKAWEEKTNELIELQKLWRTIGPVPRKVNTKIFLRFKDACDTFFSNKKEYFKHLKDEQNNNLQLKIELCMQVEAIKDSTEWRKTTDEIIGLQKKWKEIGSIPNKHSDIIWKRFRSACDAFFQAKEKFFATIDETEKENLRKKNEIIDNIMNFKPSEDSNENINQLKGFQNAWTLIGHVPIKNKDDVQKRFREALNKQFNDLKLDRSKIEIMQFKSKVESYANEDRSKDKLHAEKFKIHDRIKMIESDLNLWENNIGFFAKSKNAESLIKDFKDKIEKAKSDIQQQKDKLKMIDNLIKS